mmetsp:Transcript_78875/g.235083  ORF Transcript_78875/g.235083 Transcript_78875/m.235083 type:complete len:221 (-) Transcript_78875:191-853(-)
MPQVALAADDLHPLRLHPLQPRQVHGRELVRRLQLRAQLRLGRVVACLSVHEPQLQPLHVDGGLPRRPLQQPLHLPEVADVKEGLLSQPAHVILPQLGERPSQLVRLANRSLPLHPQVLAALREDPDVRLCVVQQLQHLVFEGLRLPGGDRLLGLPWRGDAALCRGARLRRQLQAPLGSRATGGPQLLEELLRRVHLKLEVVVAARQARPQPPAARPRPR